MNIDTDSLLKLPLTELISRADKVRRETIGSRLDLCGIINAKSGLCAEDCKFCAQSARHSAGIAAYPLIDKDKIVHGAARAKKNGARRFGIVTSGNTLTPPEIDAAAGVIEEIRSNIGIEICASLGAIEKRHLSILKDAGLTRYHHNIETSEHFYPRIVTSHPFAQRIETIRMVQQAGLEVCSGGIIGMGEDWTDRVDMAVLLRRLNVHSVPLNFLVPIKGTPLERTPIIPAADALRTIALFRIILPDKTIKIAAGRESVLKDAQMMGFAAGANGMLIGGYLTVPGRSVEDDHRLVEEVGELWRMEIDGQD